MNKAYKRIDWENEPSEKTPVNEDNLNRMDSSLDVIDDRVVELYGYEERAAASAAAAEGAAVQSRDLADLAAGSEAQARELAGKAQEAETSAGRNAELSESYAVGGTGTREEEDTDNARYYKEQAMAAQENAKTSAEQAKASQDTADASAIAAHSSETQSKESQEDAANSATAAGVSAAVAGNHAASAGEASENAGLSADRSQSYAVGGTGKRTGEDTDNAKYYKEQAERIAEGLNGALIPMGTISFTDLPNESVAGYMYNISDEFCTTDRFKEGAGNTIPAGTNVYYTGDGFWDCMAGSPVTGIKGNKENAYRRGNVNITPDDIGAFSDAGGTINGKLQIQSSAYPEAGVKAWVDNEGANLRLSATDGTYYEMDTLNGGFRMYTYGLGSVGTYKNMTFDQNGNFSVSGEISDGFGNKLSSVSTKVESCLKSVSDGKSIVAGAITVQGVSTAADAAFSTLAANVTSAGNARYNIGYSTGVADADNRANPASNNYKTGYSAGVTAADARVNASSASYTTGYNNGVAAADNRANTSSVNYKTGYNAGYSAGRTQGRNDVKNSPGSYNLYTKSQYDANYDKGYKAGVADGAEGKYKVVKKSYTINTGVGGHTDTITMSGLSSIKDAAVNPPGNGYARVTTISGNKVTVYARTESGTADITVKVIAYG